MYQNRSEVIKTYPIGNGLEAFRSSYHEICNNILGSPRAMDLLDLEVLQKLSINLLLSLEKLPACRLLQSSGDGKNLSSDVLRVISAINSGEFDFDRIKPLLKATLAENLDDTLIWGHVYDLTTISTPPLRTIASFIEQTPWNRNTSSLVNSSELRHDIDRVLKQELEPLYVGVPNFHETFFNGVPNLETASKRVFNECTKGNDPLFNGGWTRWPRDAKENEVVAWFVDLIPRLETYAGDHNSTQPPRKLLAQPKTPLLGSTSKRSLDIGFVDGTTYSPNATDLKYCWSHILVPGELKSNPTADVASIAWIDLARYAREVLAAQDTRRFILGFTLCGSLMRVWEFDRIGGIASEQFDINKNGELFIKTVLGFLWMDRENLGFDPTIIISASERFIEIERDGKTERLIIDELMKRAKCIAGRATTCWKAHWQNNPQIPLVIKDSWQFTSRDEEGELLQEATKKGVVNIARYYHHETVRVRYADDDILNNIRKGLDITKATNYLSTRSKLLLGNSKGRSSRNSRNSRNSQSSSAGLKRASSETNALMPPSKRSCSKSSTKHVVESLANRIHRRTIICDYGKPIYEATSRMALLAGLAGCLEGHESLYNNAGLLHRDISMNNLMINDDPENPSRSAFLIDLDLAIRERRELASGAKGKTGTRAFMAIGVLLGEQHSFMHDLESFFWVLFWICIHFNGQRERVVQSYEKWNYVNTEELAVHKRGVISDEGDFLQIAEADFTPYYRPLIARVNRLRQKVFPNGGRWRRPNADLYRSMKTILLEPEEDQPQEETAGLVAI